MWIITVSGIMFVEAKQTPQGFWIPASLFPKNIKP